MLGMKTFRYRVVLDLKDEEVFADISVSEETKLIDFYQHIIKQFGFSGEQMASFYLSNDEWDKGDEISLMDMSELGDGTTMDNVSFKDIHSAQGDKLILIYDFLRMWIFLIELVDITENDTSIIETIMAFGDAPSEDDKEIDGGEELITEIPNDEYDFLDEYGLDDDIESEGFENIDDYDI
jgi:hypothetical protein